MLNKVVDKVLNPLFFQIVILSVTSLTLVPFVHYAYGGYVKCVLVLGIIVCFWQFAKKKTNAVVVRDKASIATLCFALFYCISILINRESSLSANVKQLLYMVLFFTLLFFANEFSVNMDVVSGVIAVITFALSLISIVLFILNIREWYILGDEFFLGVGRGRILWGLYNPNTCASVAVVSIISSLYLLLKSRVNKSLLRGFLLLLIVINVVIQFIVLSLTGSRGALVGLASSLSVTLFILIAKNFKREKTLVVIRVILAFTMSVLLLVCVFASSSIIRINREKLWIVSAKDANNAEMDTFLEDVIEDILKKYTDDTSALAGLIKPKVLSINDSFVRNFDLDINNLAGRSGIWKAGFTVFLKRPVFGWTREGFVVPVNYYSEKYNFSSEAVVSGGLHNIYLTVLCASGLAGFSTFIVLLCIVLVRFLKKAFRKEQISPELLFSFTMSFYFLISDLVESRILYTVSFFNVVFWIYFGYLNYYSKKEQTAIEKER